MSSFGSCESFIHQPTTSGHSLPGIDYHVQQYLLDLIGVDKGFRHRLEMLVNGDPVFVQLPFQQNQCIFYQLGDVGRFLAAGARSGHAQHAVGDLCGSRAGRQYFFEGFVARNSVLVAHSHFRIVDDCHQHVVELVGGCADKLAQRS